MRLGYAIADAPPGVRNGGGVQTQLASQAFRRALLRNHSIK